MTTLLEDLRVQKNRRLFRRFLTNFIGIFLFFVGLIMLLNTAPMQVQGVEVEGSKNSERITQIAIQELKKRLWFIVPRTNIFFVPSSTIRQEIFNQLPQVIDVTVKQNALGTITVSAQERKPWIVLCRSSMQICFYVSEDGVIYEEAPLFEGDALTKIIDERENDIYAGSRLLSLNQFVQFKKLYGGFTVASGSKFSHMRFLKNDRVEFESREGWRSIFDLEGEADEMLDNLRVALTVEIKDKRKNLDYIDLRFGNKIFFKFK